MSCGVTESYNQLVGETIVEVNVTGINCVYLKTASGRFFTIYTVCHNPIGIHSMEVTETTEDNYSEMKEESNRFNQLNIDIPDSDIELM